MTELRLRREFVLESTLKEIKWLTERKTWHPGTIVKHIKEELNKIGITSELIKASRADFN